MAGVVAGGGALAGTLVMALLFSACATGSEISSASTVAGSGRAADPGSSWPASTKELSSVDELLGVSGTPEQRKAALMRQQAIQQRAIAACMRTEGFEYVEFVPDLDAGVMTGPELGAEREWQKMHGFGVADSMESSSVAQQEDPNAVIASKLSPEDRAAYDRAFYGGGSAPGGCMAAGSGQGVWQTLDPLLSEMHARVANDSRMKALEVAYVSCMRAQGYSLANREDAYRLILEEQGRIASGQVAAGDTAAAATTTADLLVPGAPGPEQIAALRVFEMKLSSADLSCVTEKELQERLAIRQEYGRKMTTENSDVFDKANAELNSAP